MAHVEIPEPLRVKMGPEMKMDVHWIDVKTRGGRVEENLVVRGGKVITGRKGDPSGVGPIDFSGTDIVNVRRHSWLPYL